MAAPAPNPECAANFADFLTGLPPQEIARLIGEARQAIFDRFKGPYGYDAAIEFAEVFTEMVVAGLARERGTLN